MPATFNTSRHCVGSRLQMEHAIKHDDFPAEEDATVSLSDQVTARLRQDGADLAPAIEAGQIMNLILEHSEELLSEEGRKTLNEIGFSSYTGIAHSAEYRRSSRQNVVVLLNLEGAPVAMYVQERHNIHGAYKIYGAEALYAGDRPMQHEANVYLYPWFRVSESDCDTRAVSAWSGASFRPMWQARFQ